MDLQTEQGPVFINLDPQQTITGINKAGCALLGCTPADVIGRDWFETFLPQQQPGGPLSSDKSHNSLFEHTVQTATGILQPIRWHTSIIHNGHGEVAGSIAMGTLIGHEHDKAISAEEGRESRKAVLSAALEAQEKERQLLAEELHESVTQILTTCKLILEHNEGCNGDPATQQAIVYLQKVINRVRGISHWLNPKQLSEIGLVAAIGEMIKDIAPQGKPHILLHASEPKMLAKLEAGVQLSLFRIIQEQCSNIVRYAQATRADIYLQLSFDAVELKITDNGIGFNRDAVQFGLGLRNIKSRAENHEGSMHLDSAPGAGCRLQVRLPLK